MNEKTKKTLFHVRTRPGLGTSAVRKLSKTSVAGNIYGVQKDSTAILMDIKGFLRLHEEEGDTGLIYLEIDENKTQVPVLIDEVQTHPVSGSLQHVVFRRVNLKEKLSASVPIELVGENSVPESNVIQVLNELEVEALPTDFPESFQVDISLLKEIGDSITIADLEYDKSKVTIEFSGDMDETAPVVLLQEVKEEVEEEPTEEAGEEATESTEAPEEGGQDSNQEGSGE